MFDHLLEWASKHMKCQFKDIINSFGTFMNEPTNKTNPFKSNLAYNNPPLSGTEQKNTDLSEDTILAFLISAKTKQVIHIFKQTVSYFISEDGQLMISSEVRRDHVAMFKKNEKGQMILTCQGKMAVSINNEIINGSVTLESGDKLGIMEETYYILFGHSIDEIKHKLDRSISTIELAKERRRYFKLLQKSIIHYDKIVDELSEIENTLEKDFINTLYSTLFLYLKTPNSTKYLQEMKTISRKIVLQGPLGSQLIQDRLVFSIAKRLGVNVLILEDNNVEEFIRDGVVILKKFRPNDKVKYIGHQKNANFLYGNILRVGDHKAVVSFGKDSNSVVTCDLSELEHCGPFRNQDKAAILVSALDDVVNKSDTSLIVYFRGDNQILRIGAIDELKSYLDKSKANVAFIYQSILDDPKKTQLQFPDLYAALKADDAMSGLFPIKGSNEDLYLDSATEHGVSNMKTPGITSSFKMVLKIQPGNDLVKWKHQLKEDEQKFIHDHNIKSLLNMLTRNNIMCKYESNPYLSSRLLVVSEVEQIVTFAIYDSIRRNAFSHSNLMMVIPPESIDLAIESKKLVLQNKATTIDFGVEFENEYEKKLSSEIIVPEDISVSFNDIGALEKVKQTLSELVFLPLKRPELFKRGNLLKPCKGILLFGPPGTGKTMLAKAIATESGAHFINVSMSSIASKWFGDGEKLARALFTLAVKLAPSIIFIDEVDSFLCRRDKNGEHEAMRKIKNEFMAMWDGLHSKEYDRVLVLAATNRPFDLDDAVLRRLQRRIFVDLPDEENRKKIFSLILANEEIDQSVDIDEIAKMTEGFSGSDIKNLCIEAAYEPVRELLKRENKPDTERNPLLHLRPLRYDDFKKARETLTSTVSEDSTSISELRQWNDTFGEGGNRKKSVPTYFM